MNIIKKRHYSIFFGTALHGCNPTLIKGLASSQISHDPFGIIKKKLGSDVIFFLHQTHSDTGKIISSSEDAQQSVLIEEGDYIITNQPGYAIGVLTADCLPVVLYDSVCKVIGVVHAGWRGSVKEIAVKALQAMRSAFGTKPENIETFFGPAARACCYEIKDDVREQLGDFKQEPLVVQQRDKKIFLDTTHLNMLQLAKYGVRKSALYTKYSVCTMCSGDYHSFRKTKTVLRQITVVSIQP